MHGEDRNQRRDLNMAIMANQQRAQQLQQKIRQTNQTQEQQRSISSQNRGKPVKKGAKGQRR